MTHVLISVGKIFTIIGILGINTGPLFASAGLVGAGLAFAEKYNKTGNLAICYFGDGAVRQGALHEAFNMAMTWKLPAIFVVENNGYAMGTSVTRTYYTKCVCVLYLGNSNRDSEKVNSETKFKIPVLPKRPREIRRARDFVLRFSFLVSHSHENCMNVNPPS